MISAVLVANCNYNLCQEQNELILLPAFLKRKRVERKSVDSHPRMSYCLIAGLVSLSHTKIVEFGLP